MKIVNDPNTVAWIKADMQASVDKINDAMWSFMTFVLNLGFTQWRPNNIPWYTKMQKPKANETPTQRGNASSSVLMESEKSETADMTAVKSCNIMQNRRRPSKVDSLWGGRSERCEAIATLAPAIIPTTRLSATARMPKKMPKEFPSGKRSCIKDRIATCTVAENVACVLSVRTDMPIT